MRNNLTRRAITMVAYAAIMAIEVTLAASLAGCYCRWARTEPDHVMVFDGIEVHGVELTQVKDTTHSKGENDGIR